MKKIVYASVLMMTLSSSSFASGEFFKKLKDVSKQLIQVVNTPEMKQAVQIVQNALKKEGLDPINTNSAQRIAARNIVFSAYGYDKAASEKEAPIFIPTGKDLEKVVREDSGVSDLRGIFLDILKGENLVDPLVDPNQNANSEEEEWKKISSILTYTDAAYSKDRRNANALICKAQKQEISWKFLSMINPKYVSPDYVKVSHVSEFLPLH